MAPDILRNYKAFAYVGWLERRFKRPLDPAKANLVLTLIFASGLAAAARIDGTLFMSGTAVGFLQHPGILIFLSAQCIIPFSVAKSIKNFLDLPNTAAPVLTAEAAQSILPAHISQFRLSLLADSNVGRAVYSICTFLGLCAFAWNTYQNQMPFEFVKKDFWDSVYHPWGYWSTRIYKFYLLVLLAPALTHAQIVLSITARTILLSLSKRRGIRLKPYHSDECGGVNIFIDSVINPMIPVVVASSLLTLAAFVVHGKYDITTIGGLILTCTLFIILYMLPAAALKKCIADEKHRQLAEITKRQDEIYDKITNEDDVSKISQSSVGILCSLREVCKNVKDLPNWPQFSKVTKIIGAACSSPFIAWSVNHIGKILARLYLL